MKFIRLNTKGVGLVPSVPIAVNADRIATVASSKDGSAVISFSYAVDGYFIVQESLEQVMELLLP